MSNFPCSGCSADLQYSPEDGVLECPYCGAKTEITVPSGDTSNSDVPAEVVEYDLESALRVAPKGWASEVKEFECKNCSAVTTVEPHVTATVCAFCGTNQLEVQPIAKEDFIRPESLLPFRIEEGTARDSFLVWVKSLWFRPNDLKRLAKLDGLKGLYVPIFTFDMKSYTEWQAEAGFHYYVSVSDGKGGTRRQRRTRWEWRSGDVRLDFDDWLVSASTGLEQDLFDGLLPFDTNELVPYDTRYLAGFIAERYQHDLASSWARGESGMDEHIGSAVVRDIPGDTYRNLSSQTKKWDKTFKHCLVPVWISAYRYKEKTFHYAVNGVTGKMHGTAPWSWIKITLAIVSVALAGYGLVVFSEQ